LELQQLNEKLEKEIIERKDAEKSLRESDDRYSKLVSLSPDAIFVLQEGRIVFNNEASVRLLGAGNSQAILGKLAVEFASSDSKAKWEERLLQVTKYGNKISATGEEIIRLNGEVAYVDSVTIPFIYDGKPSVLNYVKDITARKLSEGDLLESRSQLRALANRLTNVEEDMRKRIARDLHDRVGSQLAALNINLNILQNELGEEATKKATARLADSMTLLEETAGHIRDVMAKLRPQVLDDYGLLPALHWYCERFSGRTGIFVEVKGVEFADPLSQEVEIALFRIAQEALANVLKHANTDRAEVVVEGDGTMVQLTISDKGAGFDLVEHRLKKQSGWGLITMRERAIALGGDILMESEPDNGTRIVVEVKSC
jgi:PAS domain S-box-containing protein